MVHVGEVRYGVVSSIEQFGVFVDLGGFNGMVNAANFTWTHFERFSDLVEVGQNVAVVILDVDEVRQRVSLSMKELEPDPLVAFARSRLQDTIPGVVDKIVPIGTIVRLSEGIAGLVPVDDPGLAAGNPSGRPYAVADAVGVTVRSINMRLRRIRLAMATAEAALA
ncbi:S1 RNA-binding domain-containing protein [Yinghuangia aomiensis]